MGNLKGELESLKGTNAGERRRALGLFYKK
jgi:hypothetical protein